MGPYSASHPTGSLGQAKGSKGLGAPGMWDAGGRCDWSPSELGCLWGKGRQHQSPWTADPELLEVSGVKFRSCPVLWVHVVGRGAAEWRQDFGSGRPGARVRSSGQAAGT